jgi:WD40 repeat protein
MNDKVGRILSLGLSLLALCGAGVGVVLGWGQYTEARKQAEDARTAAELAGGKAHRAQQDLAQQERLLIDTRQELQELKKTVAARDAKARAEKPDTPKGPSEGPLQEFKGHEGAILCADFFPDGRRVVSGGADKTIRVWDIRKGEAIVRLEGHTDAVIAVGVLGTQGRELVSVGADGTVRVWDAEQGKELRKLGGPDDQPKCLAVSRDQSLALTGGADKMVHVWDVAKGEEKACFKGHTGTVLDVALFKDNKFAVSCGTDRTVRVWNTETGQEVFRSDAHQGWVYRLALYELGNYNYRYLLSGGANGIVCIHSFYDQSKLNSSPVVMKTEHGPILRLAPLSQTAFVWAGEDGGLHKGSMKRMGFDDVLKSAEGGAACAGHREPCRCTVGSADGARLLTGGDDKTLRLWQAP